MTDAKPAPASGLARRRSRLSDEETERRMLRSALAMVNKAGLTVSLEHISFEDVIRDAGVARSAVYRRWPYKDLFFSDLLKELAKGASPAIVGDNPAAIEAINRILLRHLDWLENPDSRIALAAEALRQGALAEFETFHGSPEWRTYFALHATFLGLPAGDLRDEVRAALTASERILIERVASAYQKLAGVLGLRLRPELNATFHAVATLASATIRGLVLMAPANPAVADLRFVANPFGAPEPAEWSQPALGMASVTLSFLEPDPTVKWTEKRRAEVRRSLTTSDWVGG